jgi:uncharacterized membrane protein required for colicin V production
MNTVDILVLAVLFLNGAIGAFRGFVWQVFRLGSLVLAFWLGNHYSARLADRFPASWMAQDPTGRNALAWIVIGLGTYLVFSLLGHALRSVIDRMRLASSDRALGFLLGAAKGVVICALIFQMLIVFFPVLPGHVQAQLRGGAEGTPPPSEAFLLHHRLLSDQLRTIVPERLRSDFERGFMDSAGKR